MATTYPPKLKFDRESQLIDDYFLMSNIAPVRFEIQNTDDGITTYRFANQRRQGCCYVVFDRDEE